MKCQVLFSGKNKKSIINLSSAESAPSMVTVNNHLRCGRKRLTYAINIIVCYLFLQKKKKKKKKKKSLTFTTFRANSADDIFFFFFFFKNKKVNK